MKVLLCSLIAAALSAMVDPNATTTQTQVTADGNVRVMVMARGTGDGEPVVVQAVGQPGQAFAFTQADGATAVAGEDGVLVATVNVDTEDGAEQQQHVIHMRHLGANEPDAAKRGWLGVSIGPVPESVSSQVESAADGVTVLNVVAGSPADRAGILAHDIILSVGGEAVNADVGETTRMISERGPGENVEVVILRDGRPQSITLTLGARSEMGAAAWKFQLQPGEVEEHVRTFGRMLQKDANGNWVMKNLGELDDLSQLPAQIQAFVPQGENRTVQVTVNNGEKNIAVSVERDGTTIEVEQAGDGPITVTRTNDQGAEETATYATRDELTAADPEAAEILGDSDHTMIFQLDGDGALGALGNLNFNFDTEIDVETLHENMMQWHEQFQEGLGAAGESYQQAMEEIREAVERIKEEHGIDGNAFSFMFAPQFGHGTPVPPATPQVRLFGKARTSFEVRPDGTIEATTRRGDTEIVELFTNESDLQQRDPELYGKFTQTRNAEH